MGQIISAPDHPANVGLEDKCRPRRRGECHGRGAMFFKFNCRLAIAGLLLFAPVKMTQGASATEQLKVAVGQGGAWDSGVSEIGQRAGIFNKHGLELDIVYTQGSGETSQ